MRGVGTEIGLDYIEEMRETLRAKKASKHMSK